MQDQLSEAKNAREKWLRLRDSCDFAPDDDVIWDSVGLEVWAPGEMHARCLLKTTQNREKKMSAMATRIVVPFDGIFVRPVLTWTGSPRMSCNFYQLRGRDEHVTSFVRHPDKGAGVLITQHAIDVNGKVLSLCVSFNCWTRKTQEWITAIGMVWHARLGRASLLRSIDKDVFALYVWPLVCEYLVKKSKWTGYEREWQLKLVIGEKFRHERVLLRRSPRFAQQ